MDDSSRLKVMAWVKSRLLIGDLRLTKPNPAEAVTFQVSSRLAELRQH